MNDVNEGQMDFQKSIEEIRAEINALYERLEKLKAAEAALSAIDGSEPVLSAVNDAVAGKPETVTSAILDLLARQGPMRKGDIEDTLSDFGYSFRPATISGTLQALKRRGKVIIRQGRWKIK